MPSIATNRNAAFGGTLITSKYSPLLDPVLTDDIKPVCNGIVTNRRDMLALLNVFPQTLQLAAVNWPAMVAAEAAMVAPPIVVISSNRSNWIAAGIDAADARLLTFPGPPAHFANVTDLRALATTDPHFGHQALSPPMYIPTRVGPGRNVYMVVHTAEYLKYRGLLQPRGINVIGWRFATAPGAAVPLGHRLVGLGASRFAAIEFMKTLRARVLALAGGAGAGVVTRGWLFDDNVVAITGFPGLAAAQAAMAPNDIALGFNGTTKIPTVADTQLYADNRIAAGAPQAPAGATMPAVGAPGAPANKGLLQQVVLWNIQRLANENRNFSPIFVTSGEDMSFASYFDRLQIPYKFYGMGVRKEEIANPGPDIDAGGALVTAARYRWAQQFADLESPPPPGVGVTVQSTNPEDDNAQFSLGAFVVDKVLPNAGAVTLGQRGDPNFQNASKCMAGEQIARLAIDEGKVDQGPMNTVFIQAALPPTATFNVP